MPRFRWTCCCLPGCLGAVALPLIGAVLVYRMNTETPDSTPQPAPPPVAERKQAEKHIQNLQEESARAVKAAKKGQHVPFKLVVSENDVNTYLSTDPTAVDQLRKRGLENVHVTLGDGKVMLDGKAPVWGRRLWMKAEGHLRAEKEGRIYFDLTQIEAGRMKFPLPPSVQEQLKKSFQEQTSGIGFRVPGEIKTLQVKDGKFVLEGVTDPQALKQMEQTQKQHGIEGGNAPPSPPP